MTQKELICQEIERRIAFAEKCADAACEKNLHNELEANEMLTRQYKSLLAFINSLPEEKPSEELNKLIQKWDIIDINTVLKVKVKATGKVIDGFYDGRGHFDHFIDHDVFDRYFIDEVELMPKED